MAPSLFAQLGIWEWLAVLCQFGNLQISVMLDSSRKAGIFEFHSFDGKRWCYVYVCDFGTSIFTGNRSVIEFGSFDGKILPIPLPIHTYLQLVWA